MNTPYYSDDRVTLYGGDALAVLAALPSGSVDAVITDPPYSSGGRRENARALRKSMIRSMEDAEWIPGDSMSTAGFIWTMRTFGMEARRVLKPGGHLLAFIDWRMYPNLALALESADLRQHPTLVWDKTQFGMGSIFRNQHEWICHFSAGAPAAPARRDVGNVIPCPPVRGGEHPTQKPLPLMETLVSVVTEPDAVILDPFMGSGATGVAAILRRRRFIGVEMSETYQQVAQRRILTAAGVAAEKGDQAALDFDGGAA